MVRPDLEKKLYTTKHKSNFSNSKEKEMIVINKCDECDKYKEEHISE